MTTGNWRNSLICLICFISIAHSLENNKLLGIKNYACYYGKGRINDLAKYDLAVNKEGMELLEFRKFYAEAI